MAENRTAQLLGELKASQNEWEQLLVQVDKARWNEAGVTGEWALKDVLAHLTAWAGRAVAWTDAIRAGTTPQPAPWPKDLSEDEENDWIFRAHQGQDAAELDADWRATNQALTSNLGALPESDIFEKKYQWLGGKTLAEALPGNTWEHAREHAAIVRAWLSRQAVAG
jgi:hypothetical protein